MKKQNKIRNILIYILASLLVGLKYFALSIAGWTSVILIMIGLAILFFLSVLIVMQIVDIVKNKQFKFKFMFPVIFTILTLLFLYYGPVETLIEKAKSPVNLRGYCEHTVTAPSLQFREDKTFEYNAGAFLEKEIYTGTYEIYNDTVCLSFEPENSEILNNKLILNQEFLIELGDTLQHRHKFKLTINNIK
ncbi:MAG TPA: hypothetical protein DCG75_17175 [Bacteroidales bacterium]|nr:hypothetical protein [Bacteroidales bacterium]